MKGKEIKTKTRVGLEKEVDDEKEETAKKINKQRTRTKKNDRKLCKGEGWRQKCVIGRESDKRKGKGGGRGHETIFPTGGENPDYHLYIFMP